MTFRQADRGGLLRQCCSPAQFVTRAIAAALPVPVTGEIDPQQAGGSTMLHQVMKNGDPIALLIVPVEPVAGWVHAQGSPYAVKHVLDQRPSSVVTSAAIRSQLSDMRLRLYEQPFPAALNLHASHSIPIDRRPAIGPKPRPRHARGVASVKKVQRPSLGVFPIAGRVKVEVLPLNR